MKTKRSISTFLIIVLLLTAVFMTGCNKNDSDKEQIDELTAENEILEERITELEDQIDGLSNISPEVVEPIEYSYALGINCLLYVSDSDADTAKNEFKFEGETSISALPIIPEGFVVDYWAVNGIIAENQGAELKITVNSNTVIEAVLREELKVASINAYMQFLNSSGKPEGEKFYEYVFEYDTEMVTGKMISVYVSAEVPNGYEVDYWLINNVPYYFNRTISNFTVKELDATIFYEVVLKKEAVATAQPTAVPVTNVTISCTNATFSGGGYSNATSGSVPKGTTIIITGKIPIGNPTTWIINGSEDVSKRDVNSFSYTVNSNTIFVYDGIN